MCFKLSITLILMTQVAGMKASSVYCRCSEFTRTLYTCPARSELVGSLVWSKGGKREGVGRGDPGRH